jgi:hypothetical protein
VGMGLRVLKRPTLLRLKHLDIQPLLLRADREPRVVGSPALSHHRPLAQQLLRLQLDPGELIKLIRIRKHALRPSIESE